MNRYCSRLLDVGSHVGCFEDGPLVFIESLCKSLAILLSSWLQPMTFASLSRMEIKFALISLALFPLRVIVLLLVYPQRELFALNINNLRAL